MPNPLLIFRIGWMESYQGIDEIQGGGSYVAEHGEGGEMWNFREEGGKFYGYAMTRNFSGIDLSRISSERDWEKGEELTDVDIVFISRSPDPDIGQVVVGWYKKATVFHKEYRKRRGRRKDGDWKHIDYLCEVSSDDAHLLEIADRTFSVPRGKGFPGQSNAWYENSDNSDNSEVVNFKKRLRKYIATGKAGRNLPSSRNRPERRLGQEEILAIERAAVEKVWEHFEDNGYRLTSVEADNAGWDLEAAKDGKTLLLEVKGHKGNVIQFELTPNEYLQLQERKKVYRVCVVRNALSEPDLKILAPRKAKGSWLLAEVEGNEKIRLDEKVAAKAVQIGF